MKEAIFVAVVLAVVCGYVLNIVKLADMCCELSGMLILRVVGLFLAPLGAVLGFL